MTERNPSNMWEDPEPESEDTDDVLFSVNPISGKVEAYTSEGQFRGFIETTGDSLDYDPDKDKPETYEEMTERLIREAEESEE